MISPHELSHGQSQSVMASFEIPACPTVVAQVMSEARKDAPDMSVLAHIIAGDLGMSAFAISLAHSALFRRGEAAHNVSQAVMRLGARNVICVVMAVALRNMLSGELPADILERFWHRAGATAMAAGLIARKLRGIQADTAYAYALFHDAAMPLLMRRHPDYFGLLEQASPAGLELVDEEYRRYGCTHALVGGVLARDWGLPAVIVGAIRHHHEPELYDGERLFLDDASLALVAVTHVAEHLLASLEKQVDSEEGGLFAPAAAYLGLSEDDLRDLREAVAELQA